MIYHKVNKNFRAINTACGQHQYARDSGTGCISGDEWAKNKNITRTQEQAVRQLKRRVAALRPHTYSR